MPIRNILVTGGAGYIGSHLVDALVAREYRVTVLDNLEPQVHRSGSWPSYVNARAEYVRGDVRDRTVFEPLVLQSDAVVHFGAAVSVGQSMYQVDRYVDVNTRGTALLLDILVNTNHHVQKVLVASSIGVYGEGAYACDTHGPVAPTIRSEAQLAARDWEQHCPVCGRHVRSIPTPETKALYRDNIYSMTKYHQEEMVLLIGKTYGIPAVAPRFFNVYGPRQSLSNPYAGVAAIWLSRLLNGKPPVVFEDGGQLRDFVSIHDVVDCLVLMIEKPGADYLPVNVGSGTTVTIREIAELLSRLLGSSIEPLITQTGRKFDIRHNTADIGVARSTLGFAPNITLEEGFGALIEWAKSSPDMAVDFFDRALDELKEKGLVVGAGRPGGMILDFEQLAEYRGSVAMVDGAFDPLHKGHIEYFRAAAAAADVPLLCNVASDSYVWTKHPPLLPEEQRVAVLDAIRYLTYVHLNRFDTETVLRQLRPKYYVKGRDWDGRLPAEQVAICADLHIGIVYLDTVLDSSSRILQQFGLQKQNAE